MTEKVDINDTAAPGKVRIEITPALIEAHGRYVGASMRCPCYAWLERHGYGPCWVSYEGALLEGNRSLGFPQEFVDWQQAGVAAVRAGAEPASALKPIAFDAELS